MGASNSRFLIGAALAGITAMPVPVAMAQGEATRSAAAASDFRLEEIVVTSRKREENLQDAGFSVSALGRADLERRPDIDLSSFENAAPNVIITDMQEGPGNPASMTIRGIGTSDHERSIDPTVGVVVDGVFIGTVGGAMVKALDVERLEILRGPQGTLFGRNAIGGALLLDRVKPDTADFSGKMRGGYGNYDSVQLDAYVNVPLADRFAVKVGGAYSRHDGYFYNTFLDRRQGEDETRSINVAALLKPTDNIELYYRFDRQWIDQDAAVMHNVAAPNQVWCFFYNQCAVDGKTPQAGDRYRSVQNDPDFDAFFNSSMHIFTANWQISDGYSIDYLFGRFSTNEDAQWDFDGTPLTLYHTNRPQKYEQNSHELRLSYASPRLNYTVGVYLYDAKYRIENLSTIGFGDLAFGLSPGTIFTTLQIVQQKTDSYAVFFEGDYSFTDA
ncbi:MAG TPA: TonB-dependent receptor plug domain-containing protein, partial [Sphingomonadales bacterium]